MCLLGLRSRMANLMAIYNTLARKHSFTSTQEGSRKATPKHQPNRPPIIHDSVLISFRQCTATAANKDPWNSP
jgi:hypothetical protein